MCDQWASWCHPASSLRKHWWKVHLSNNLPDSELVLWSKGPSPGGGGHGPTLHTGKTRLWSGQGNEGLRRLAVVQSWHGPARMLTLSLPGDYARGLGFLGTRLVPVLNTRCPLLYWRISLVPKSALTLKAPLPPLLMSTQPVFPHPPTFKLFLSLYLKWVSNGSW